MERGYGGFRSFFSGEKKEPKKSQGRRNPSAEGGYFLFVHELSILHRSKHARLTACSKFCTGVYPFHQTLCDWSPSPSKRWRLTSVRQRSFLRRSKDCAFDGGKYLLRRDNPSVTAFAVPAPFTQGSLTFVHELSILHRSRKH